MVLPVWSDRRANRARSRLLRRTRLLHNIGRFVNFSVPWTFDDIFFFLFSPTVVPLTPRSPLAFWCMRRVLRSLGSGIRPPHASRTEDSVEIMVPSCGKVTRFPNPNPTEFVFFVMLCRDEQISTSLVLKQRHTAQLRANVSTRPHTHTHTPGTGWGQERAAPACTPDLRSEPVTLCQTLCHTGQEKRPAETTTGIKTYS